MSLMTEINSDSFAKCLDDYKTVKADLDKANFQNRCSPYDADKISYKDIRKLKARLALKLASLRTHPSYPAYIEEIDTQRLALRRPHREDIDRVHMAMDGLRHAMQDCAGLHGQSKTLTAQTLSDALSKLTRDMAFVPGLDSPTLFEKALQNIT